MLLFLFLHGPHKVINLDRKSDERSWQNFSPMDLARLSVGRATTGPSYQQKMVSQDRRVEEKVDDRSSFLLCGWEYGVRKTVRGMELAGARAEELFRRDSSTG